MGPLPLGLGTGGHGRVRNQPLDSAWLLRVWDQRLRLEQSCSGSRPQRTNLVVHVTWWAAGPSFGANCSVQAEAPSLSGGVENLEG